MPFNVQAALGHGQFTRIEELIAKKRHVFHLYRELLPKGGVVQVNLENDERINGAWATTVVFSRESGVTTQHAIDHLAGLGIPLRPFFYPLSSLPAYADNSTGGVDRHPVAYDLASRGVHLPCALNLTDQQVARVAHALNELLDSNVYA